MSVSILVPFGADDSPEGLHRSRVWGWCRRRWEALREIGLVSEVVVGHDPLVNTAGLEYALLGMKPPANKLHKFSVSRALNDAAKHARGDTWLLFGADHVPDPKIVVWADTELRKHPFIRLYDRVAYATQGSTQIILSNTAFPLDAADWHEVSAPCPGVLAIHRHAFESVGGMDERYEGWGYEDTDLLHRLDRAFVPPHNGRMRASGWTLRELWHPGGHRDLNGPNKSLFEGTAP